mgnify:CR=1 FL=1
MADIRISSLRKDFEAFTAVRDIDINIADGEFVFLLGPSGCGKTTTLRMIAGLEMPSSGKIEIGNRNVTYLKPRYRNVGMVFQDYGLYRHMTVFGNIAFPLEVRKIDRRAISSKVEAVARTMQISEVLNKKPDQLSAGQLQRVAIARMLVRDADIFLMDEPMSHLDAQLRAHMRAELKHIQKRIGTTTIFVTHDQLEAMTMADRILVMNEGKILQFATPIEIFERPANEFVATFVGEPQMNIMDATLRQIDGKLIADLGGVEINLPNQWLDSDKVKNQLGKNVRVGIRPEHISLSDKIDSKHSLEVNLQAFEPTGSENLFLLSAGSIEITTRTSTSESRFFKIVDNAKLSIGFDPNWLYLFDPSNGNTLAYAVASRDNNQRVQ